MVCPRGNLQHSVSQLQGLLVSETMFKRDPKPPTTTQKLSQVDKKGQ